MRRAPADTSPPPLPVASDHTVSRRQFLALGSAVVAGAAAGDVLAAVPSAAAWAATDGDWPLSVGYVVGSDLHDDLRSPPWLPQPAADSTSWTTGAGVEVAPAAQMPLGDQDLALESVEMRVHGLYPGFPPARRRTAFTSAYLAVFAPALEPDVPQPLPFLSWGSERLPWRNPAPPARFCVPLRDDGGLELLLEVGMPAGTRHRFYADFTVDWYDGRPKLQRGIYLLGLAPRVWEVPRELPAAGDRPRYDLCSLVVSFEPIAAG